MGFGAIAGVILLICLAGLASAVPMNAKPDLTISAIEISESMVGENDFFDATVYVSNDSMAIVENQFNVKVFGSLIPKNRQLHTIDGIGPGETKSFTIRNLFGKRGKKAIRARADYGNKVKESKEGNNRFKGEVKIEKKAKENLPDFRIEKIYVEEDLFKKKEFTLKLDVVNDSENAFLGPIEVRVNDQAIPKYKAIYTIYGGLGAGETYTVEITVLSVNTSTRVFQAKIDPKNKVREAKEGNNHKDKILKFRAKKFLLPNLKVTDIVVGGLSESKVADIKVTVENNTGYDISQPFMVQLRVRNPNNVVLQKVDGLASNDSPLKVSFVGILLNRGRTGILARADSAREVKERNEGDNSKRIVFRE